MNKYQLIIFFAGFFQILSQGFDQFVIQQEQKVRKAQNYIEKNKAVQQENISSNLSYGQVFVSMYDRVIIILNINDDKLTSNVLKKELVNIKNQLRKQLNLLLENPNIQKNNFSKEKLLEPFNNLDEILKKKTDPRLVKVEFAKNIRNTSQILNDLYFSNVSLGKKILESEEKLKKTIDTKFTFLVMGMISNIFSIFYALNVGQHHNQIVMIFA